MTRQKKQDQRQRIVDGMVKVVARHRYGGASVARVIEQAGVSRATFYQHFADRETCFLAAFRQCTERLAGDLEAAVQGRPGTILAGLLARIERDPAMARLVLFEALAGGPVVRAEHARWMRALEAALDHALALPLPEGVRIELPARALLGGLGSVIAVRLFRGQTGRLQGLIDDLWAWLYSYAAPVDRPRLSAGDWDELGQVPSLSDPLAEGAATDDPSPRGLGAPLQAPAGGQRERILAATARVAREKGFAKMTVADVVATAGVAREAFYDQFRSKEDAFLTVQAFVLQSSMAITASSYFGEGDWPSRVWNTALAMLGFLSSQPDLACVEFIESYVAGDAAVRRSFDTRMAYTLFLEDGYRQRPEAERLPRLCSEAIAGAVLELFRRETVEGRAEQTLALTPQGVYVTLAPFIGSSAAIESVEAKLAEAKKASSA